MFQDFLVLVAEGLGLLFQFGFQGGELVELVVHLSFDRFAAVLHALQARRERRILGLGDGALIKGVVLGRHVHQAVVDHEFGRIGVLAGVQDLVGFSVGDLAMREELGRRDMRADRVHDRRRLLGLHGLLHALDEHVFGLVQDLTNHHEFLVGAFTRLGGRHGANQEREGQQVGGSLAPKQVSFEVAGFLRLLLHTKTFVARILHR